MIENHLKVIDTDTFRLFDLLTESNYDQEAMNAMSLTRSLKDRSNRLLMLCHTGNKSYIQRIDFNNVLPFTLNEKVQKQIEQGRLQKNQLGPTDM